MCLNYLWTKKKIKEWLKIQPDPIIAYKVVAVRVGRAYPPVYYEDGPYGKTNKIEKSRKIINTIVLSKSGRGTRSRGYESFYHLFLNKKDAMEWGRQWGIFLKCKIPKKAVVDIGMQDEFEVIVTKEFTLSGNRYLKEELPWPEKPGATGTLSIIGTSCRHIGE